jgi:tRNA 2-selenouridine synthase
MLKDLIQKKTPFIDVRSPAEFNQGSIPLSINIPILNDMEREIVGKAFKSSGQETAEKIGYELVSGKIKNDRVNEWKKFIEVNPRSWLYCARGGLRSEIAQSWLKDIGLIIDRVDGGFKSIRNFCLDFFEHINEDNKDWIVLAGKTGSDKTGMINKLNNSIDLEGLANHRGSAFGARSTKQPSPVNFENSLAFECIHHKSYKLVLEDESRTIGRLVIPPKFYERMQKSKICTVEIPIEERVENIFNGYVASHLEIDKNVLLAKDRFLANLDKIMKRLGESNHSIIKKKIHEAFSNNDHNAHFEWIEKLIVNYYDKMYDYQLNKKIDRCIFRGNRLECLDYLRS